jgi:hypothetical protein
VSDSTSPSGEIHERSTPRRSHTDEQLKSAPADREIDGPLGEVRGESRAPYVDLGGEDPSP